MRTKKFNEVAAGYGFLAPALLFYVFFFGFPVVFSFIVSFRRWNMLVPLSKAKSVGLQHFEYLLNNELFVNSLINTLLYAVVVVIVALTIAVVFAVLINGAKLSVLWRFIFFTPVVTPAVAIGTIWSYLYRPNNGIFNSLLSIFGIKPVYWLTDASTVLPSVMITAVWAGLGSSILILTASLKNIPNDYYDAARIDGAGPFRQFFSITLPLLKPTILFLTATGMIGAWQVFDLPYMMGRNAPAKSIMTVSWYIYDTAFQSMRMGRASAGAFILFVVIFAVTVVILRMFRQGGVRGYED